MDALITIFVCALQITFSPPLSALCIHQCGSGIEKWNVPQSATVVVVQETSWRDHVRQWQNTSIYPNVVSKLFQLNQSFHTYAHGTFGMRCPDWIISTSSAQ